MREIRDVNVQSQNLKKEKRPQSCLSFERFMIVGIIKAKERLFLNVHPVSSFQKEGAVIFALPDTHRPEQTTNKGKRTQDIKEM